MNVLSFEEAQKRSLMTCLKIAEPYLPRINEEIIEATKEGDLYCIVDFRDIAPIECGVPFIPHQVLNYLTLLGYKVKDSSVVPAQITLSWDHKNNNGIFKRYLNMNEID